MRLIVCGLGSGVISSLGSGETVVVGSFVTPDNASGAPTAPSEFTYFKFVAMFS